MNIALVTQWFPPEQAPIGYMIKELAEALASEGHDVTIITGFPNHPAGVVFGGYQKKWVLQERIGNVNVTRAWLATSANRSRLRRIFTFLTFTFTSAWEFKGDNNKPALNKEELKFENVRLTQRSYK